MEKDKLPRHVAIIMDGNGRWAQSQHLPRTQGHAEGVKRVEEILVAACKTGIEVMTLYAFSTENWTRPQEEVTVLMRLFIMALGQKAKDVHSHGVKIRFIGSRVGVPAEVLQAYDEAMALTCGNTAMTLNVAFNYGSRTEIVEAVKALSADVLAHTLDIASINEKTCG